MRRGMVVSCSRNAACGHRSTAVHAVASRQPHKDDAALSATKLRRPIRPERNMHSLEPHLGFLRLGSRRAKRPILGDNQPLVDSLNALPLSASSGEPPRCRSQTKHDSVKGSNREGTHQVLYRRRALPRHSCSEIHTTIAAGGRGVGTRSDHRLNQNVPISKHFAA